MGSFIEPVPRYKLFNRTHALLQGYEFSRMQVLQGMSSPSDTVWGYKLGEQFFVQQSVCTCTCRFKTQKLQCYHLFILGSIYTLLNRPDIFVLDIKMLLWSKSWQLWLRWAKWLLGFGERSTKVMSTICTVY